ncbi:MAG: hypothetical protein LBG97_07370 [Coriobacteriales bacterium]|jgi:hypothetical protein|nr:hypothetical protein [Coriobacteriales bacterium]
MTLRDFSDNVKLRLTELINRFDKENDEWWGFGRIVDFVTDFFLSDSIKDNVRTIEAYHEEILDKKNMSLEQLDKVWEEVYATDMHYAERMREINEQFNQLLANIRAYTDILNPTQPDGGLAPILRSEDEFQARFAPAYEQWDTWLKSAITRDIERAFDHRAQRQVDELFASLGYTKATWNALTEDGKIAVLLEVIAALNAILRTNVDIKALKIIDDGYREDSSLLLARYEVGVNQIEVNLAALNDSKRSIDLLRGMAHEVRHAYQYETVIDPSKHIVTDETRQQWKQNFQPGNHRDGVQTEDEKSQGIVDTYEIYVSQPLEYDAAMFARNDLPNNLVPVYSGSWGN